GDRVVLDGEWRIGVLGVLAVTDDQAAVVNRGGLCVEQGAGEHRQLRQIGRGGTAGPFQGGEETRVGLADDLVGVVDGLCDDERVAAWLAGWRAEERWCG